MEQKPNRSEVFHQAGKQEMQIIQIMPRIKPDQKGANFLWSKGRAKPRHPNSSIGPRNNASANAGITSDQGENGNGSFNVPLMAAPAYIIAGIAKIISNHHQIEGRVKVNRLKKLPRPLTQIFARPKMFLRNPVNKPPGCRADF